MIKDRFAAGNGQWERFYSRKVTTQFSGVAGSNDLGRPWPLKRACVGWITALGLLICLTAMYNCAPGAPNPNEDEDYTISMHDPRVALDGSGNAVIVYEKEYFNPDETGGYVLCGTPYKGIFSQGAELMPEVSDTTNFVQDLKHINYDVDMNASGIAAVVWANERIEGGWYYVNYYSNFYLPGTGWLGVQDVDFDNRGETTGAYIAFSPWDTPKVAIGPDGDTIAVFHEEWGDSDYYVRTALYDFSTGSWPSLSSSIGSTLQVAVPRIASDGSGNTIVVWIESSDMTMRAKRYDAVAGTWLNDEPIGDLGGIPFIVLNQSGDGAAMGNFFGISVNRYSAGGGWQGAEEIVKGGTSGDASIAVDDNGNLTVVWRTTSGIHAKRYLSSTGVWQDEEDLTNDTNIEYDPVVAMFSSGSAAAVWEYEGDIYGSRYQPGSGWSTQLIGPGSDGYPAMNPHIAGDTVRAVAAWDLGVPESSQIVRQIQTFQWGSPYALFQWSPQAPVIGSTITFDAGTSRDDDGTIVSWEWDIDNNLSIDASGVTATHSFAATGTVEVRLIVTDDDGFTDELVKEVVVTGGEPVALFTYTPKTVTAADMVDFDGGGSYDNGTILFYNWDFDNDGTTDGVGEEISYRFPAEGTYTVKLTVIDDDGLEGETTQDIEVGPGIPVPDFTWTPSSPAVGDTVSFDGSASMDYDGTIVTYEWDFDNDGKTDATGVTTDHVFGTAGSQNVSLSVTDDDGWSAALVTPVTVYSSGGDHTLEVTYETAGSGSGAIYSGPVGIDCPGDCTQDYAHGTTVTLYAYPDAGSFFEGWGGVSMCDSIGYTPDTCVIYMDEDKYITGIFVD